MIGKIREKSALFIKLMDTDLIANRQSAMAMPVATGATKQSLHRRTPFWRIRSRASSLVRAYKMLEPAAFGWGSRKSPEWMGHFKTQSEWTSFKLLFIFKSIILRGTFTEWFHALDNRKFILKNYTSKDMVMCLEKTYTNFTRGLVSRLQSKRTRVRVQLSNQMALSPFSRTGCNKNMDPAWSRASI